MSPAAGFSRPRWAWSTDLDAATLYDILRLRAEVFVVEQDCTYQDLDGRDLEPGTRHFWVADDAGSVIATLRVLSDGDGGFWIGRVCTAGAYRGSGLSRLIMEAALDAVGEHRCRLNAQSYLTGMYGKLGFVVTGDEYLDHGIPHRPMERVG